VPSIASLIHQFRLLSDDALRQIAGIVIRPFTGRVNLVR
jgi:hypothetical protein